MTTAPPGANTGTGPGPQAPDGCSVALYRRMPYRGELDAIEALLRQHTEVLELGCGTGRLCAHLQSLGLAVTGVDESAEMLAALQADLPGVRTLHSTIEALDLPERWSAMLLPSHLIHHPDPSVRRGFLAAARRHVADDGSFYLMRHAPRWLGQVQPGLLAHRDGIAVWADRVEHAGDLSSMTLRYVLRDAQGEATWTHDFTAIDLDDAQIEALLHEAGFAGVRWHGAQAQWAQAVPMQR